MSYLMKELIAIMIVLVIILLSLIGCFNSGSKETLPLVSLKPNEVNWTEGFMYNEWEKCKDTIIPGHLERIKDDDVTHYWKNMLNAAHAAGMDVEGWDDTGYVSVGYQQYEFIDGDFYKWVEAACYMLAQIDSDSDYYKELDATVDFITSCLVAIQEESGFVDFKSTIQGFSHLGLDWEYDLGYPHFSPTMYSLGHLLTLGAVHNQTTGKTNLLDVSTKLADYLYTYYYDETCDICENSELHIYNWWDHTTFMGLVEVYRQTKDEKYLQLCYDLISTKGEYVHITNTQDRVLIREEIYAIGHSQRSNYLWAGLADLIAVTKDIDTINVDEALKDTLFNVWESAALRQMYITGGTGAAHSGWPKNNQYNVSPYPNSNDVYETITEAYAGDFVLPNEAAYCETCSNVGMALWNYRMHLITGDAKYMDIVELEYFNAAQAGISREGNAFFYTNVLTRPEGFNQEIASWAYTSFRTPTSGAGMNSTDTSCCPPNIIRFLAMTQNWAYNISDESKTFWVNLYGSNQINSTFSDDSPIQLTQSAPDYPWNGNMTITIDAENKFEINLRIPGWAESVEIFVNDEKINKSVTPGEYFTISKRNWKVGDVINLNIPMPVTILRGEDTGFAENDGMIAVKRGPVLYCVESPDLPDYTISVKDIYLFEDVEFTTEFIPDLLDGVMILKTTAYEANQYPFELRLIPYYTWCNRSLPASIWDKKQIAMNVWFHLTTEVDEKIKPAAPPPPEPLKPMPAGYIADFESVYPEDETQGFSDAQWYPGCLTKLYRTENPRVLSNYALAIDCDSKLSDRATLQVYDIDTENDFMYIDILLPEDYPDESTISVWASDNVSVWNWNATESFGSDHVKGEWVTVSLNIRELSELNASAFKPYGDNYILKAGIQFYFGEVEENWTGTIYIDNVRLSNDVE